MGVTLVDPTQIARDDGNGKLMLNGVQVGTVTYARARWTSPDVTIKIPKPVYSSSQVSGGGFNGEVAQYRLNYEGIEYLNAPSIYPNDESGYVKIRFAPRAAPRAARCRSRLHPSLTWSRACRPRWCLARSCSCPPAVSPGAMTAGACCGC
jgi:hypothetical protein